MNTFLPNKRLVKVTATTITGEGFGHGRMRTEIVRGIAHLKRGQTLFDYIGEFLNERGFTTYTLNQRDENSWATTPILSLAAEPKEVLSYHFIEFLSEELGFHAKDLTAEELWRDMKTLKKVLYG